MANAKKVVWEYEKLGAIDFKIDDEGNPVFSVEKTREIILMGVHVLANSKLLSESERGYFVDLFTGMEIAITAELPGRSSIQHQFNRLTGEMIDAALYISELSMYIDTDEMIKSILENLCLLIVMYKHPEERLKERGLFDPNLPFDGHSDPWIQYATALLPDKYIQQCKYSYAAYSYILNNTTAEQAEVFEDTLGEGWKSDLADQYAEELLENELTAEEYPIADFLHARYDEYTDQSDSDDCIEEEVEEDMVEKNTIEESSMNTLEKYSTLMEEKYEKEIEKIGDRLVMLSSYQKGPALDDIILKGTVNNFVYGVTF